MNKTTERIAIFAARFIEKHGMSPTIRDIGAGVKGTQSEDDLSTSVVLLHLHQLKNAGILTFDKGQARTIRFIDGQYTMPSNESILAMIEEAKEHGTWR